MKCLNLSLLIAYQNDLLNKSENEKIKQHLQSCQKCQEKVKEYKRLNVILQKTLPIAKKSEVSDCYDENQLLSFLEGTSPDKDRQDFYQHLSDCIACTDQLVSLEGFLYDIKQEGLLPVEKGVTVKFSATLENFWNTFLNKISSIGSIFRTPRRAYQFAGVLLILIVLGVVLDHQQFIRDLPFNTREPAVNQMDISLRLLSPQNSSSVTLQELEFSWSKIPQAASYTFLLLSARGDIIWEQKTTEVKLTLPTEIHLQPSGTYFWQVECLLEQGGSIVSDMTSFSFNNK